MKELIQIRKGINNKLGIDMCQDCRKREVSDAKKIFFLIARKYTTYSYKTMAEFLGKDHATAIHHYRTGTDLLGFNKEFKKKYEGCVKEIGPLKTSKDYVDSYKYHLGQCRKLRRQMAKLDISPNGQQVQII